MARFSFFVVKMSQATRLMSLGVMASIVFVTSSMVSIFPVSASCAPYQPSHVAAILHTQQQPAPGHFNGLVQLLLGRPILILANCSIMAQMALAVCCGSSPACAMKIPVSLKCSA